MPCLSRYNFWTKSGWGDNFVAKLLSSKLNLLSQSVKTCLYTGPAPGTPKLWLPFFSVNFRFQDIKFRLPPTWFLTFLVVAEWWFPSFVQNIHSVINDSSRYLSVSHSWSAPLCPPVRDNWMGASCTSHATFETIHWLVIVCFDIVCSEIKLCICYDMGNQDRCANPHVSTFYNSYLLHGVSSSFLINHPTTSTMATVITWPDSELSL